MIRRLVLLLFVLLVALGAGGSLWTDWMPSWLRSLLGVQPLAPVERFASNVGSATLPGGGANDCTSSATPCHTARILAVAVCGDTLTFLDGTYQGANYMMVAAPIGDPVVPGYVTNPTCSSGSRMTVRAQNDGRVFFDSQFGAVKGAPFTLWKLTYWEFTGFDSGNAGVSANGGENALGIYNSDHVSVKRHCASNTTHVVPDQNVALFTSNSNTNSLFEDICAFGWGRLTFYTSDQNVTGSGPTNLSHTGNIFRRIWTRWEGSSAFPGPGYGAAIGEPEYYWIEPPATLISGNDRYENLIGIWSNIQSTTNTTGGGFGRPHSPSLLDYKHGWIIYGLPGALMPGGGFYGEWQGNGAGYATNLIDLFVDGRAQVNTTVNLTCVVGTYPGCSANSYDRITALRHPSASTAIFNSSGMTANRTECTDINNCPNFYTGAIQGTGTVVGARNCFEYTNGVLGSTAATQGLWPWRMDTGGKGQFVSRIKSALARANAAGQGGAPLQGGAGSGYEAATVTSEIAARYGQIPAGCSRTTTVFVPNFPVVTDFPSTAVLDTFDRANGPLGSNWTYIQGASDFTIQSNQAILLTAGSPRLLWTATQATPQQEVYATWSTVPADGSVSSPLIFGATTTDDTTGWHLRLTRATSANDRLDISRITGGFATILGPVDLGGKVTNGDSFGIRVSALQTISVYWKYSGTWYRVGSVIDTNLPSGSTNSYIGFGGGNAIGDVVNDFGGSSTGGIAPSPGNIGRFGSRIPTQ